MQSLRVYGNTVQNLWVNPSGSSAGITVTSNSDGSVTVSGTNSTGSGSIAKSSIFALKPNTQYTLSIDKSVTGLSEHGFYVTQRGLDGEYITQNAVGAEGKTSTTFTTSSDMSQVKFEFVARNTTVSGTYRVMLNEGSTAEPWCPPGLNSVGEDGSVEVVTAGKNLLTKSEFNGIGWAYESQGTVDTLNALPVGTYKLSGVFELISSTSDSSRYGYIVMTSQGVILNASSYFWNSTVAGTVKTCANTLEITGAMRGDFTHFYIYGCGKDSAGATGSANVKLQLELGSAATDYEPPNITTTPIDLQGHTLNALPDGTRDELHIDGGGNVVLEKRCGVAVAPTTEESWTFEAEYGRGLFGISPKAISVAGIGTLLCDKFPPREVKADANKGTYSLAATVSAYARVSTIDSLSELAPIAGGATYIYKLAEPQTIDLGTVELPKLRKKPLVNTILANGTAEGTGFSLAPEIDCEYNQWSTYCDGFKTHGKHSYFDMGCCIAARDTGTPEKKSVTATVPYMSGFYDLSKLYGAIAFEARQLMYRFEFVEDSREELQQRKSQFLEWLSRVHDEEIADDDIPGRHFIGSLSEWEFEEGEDGQSGSLEVTFNCQPFLEADEDTTKTCNAGSNTVTVEGQAVNVYAKTNRGTATIRIGGVMQSVGTTEIRLSVQLQPGDNAVTVTGSPVVLRWKELTV